jgi:tricarballylate dehydrogenase
VALPAASFSTERYAVVYCRSQVWEVDVARHRADVIVVGAGNAGFSAALAARDAGADVLLVEKATQDAAGGNTYFTAGAFRTAHGGLEDLLPLLDDHARRLADRIDLGPYPPEQYLDDLERLTDGRCDPALANTLASSSRETIDWLTGHGLRWTLMVHRQAYESEGRYRFWGGLALGSVDGGKGLYDDHLRAARAAGVQLRFRSPVVDLHLDDDRAAGVVVRTDDGGTETLEAAAVVLAAGGFQADPRRRTEHLGPQWAQAKVRGTPDNTGDLLDPALRLGAGRAGDWTSAHATAWDPTGDGDRGDRELTNRMTKQSYPVGIVVNRDGRRFLDEGADYRNYTYAKYGARILDQPGAIAFQLFDAKTVPLLREDEYTSPSVRSARGSSIREVATALGIDPDGCAQTVASFNAAIQPGAFDPSVKDGLRTEGLDPDKSNWAVALDTPPFVGYAVTCGITFTYGGLRIDPDGRVLREDDAPIPGLHAAGEIAGGLFFGNYPGGSGLMAGSVFGRRAGTTAAQTKL